MANNEKKTINAKLKERIKEIYKKTSFQIKIKEKVSEKIWTKERVRQGCPLSTALFNLAFADLEDAMKEEQTGGIIIGAYKIWTVAYADDIALLAEYQEGIKGMMKRFKEYTKERGLELNVNKTKVMRTRKGGRKKR